MLIGPVNRPNRMLHSCYVSVETTCDVSRMSDRINCGYLGISRDNCYRKGCCWDTSVLDAAWCFHRVPLYTTADVTQKKQRYADIAGTATQLFNLSSAQGTRIGGAAGRATGNSREFGIAKFPAGIPGNFAKIAIGYFFPVISLFVQFHYHLQQTLSVNYNVLSIKLPTVKV